MERQEITEDMGIHNQWFDDAKEIRVCELEQFVRHLIDDYKHDYGTIVHAICAAMDAAFHSIESCGQGGITGFQAGFIGWHMVEKFMNLGDGPKRIVTINDMLYPTCENKFRSIPKPWWDTLQSEAERLLHDHKDDEYVAVQVRDHWQSIVDGKVPFYMSVEEEH